MVLNQIPNIIDVINNNTMQGLSLILQLITGVKYSEWKWIEYRKEGWVKAVKLEKSTRW